MIVSSAIAVFPVCRSPMISSRCPRPIGIIESIALMPVWSGSFTGWRSTTLGAVNSMLRKWSDPVGALPSPGWPVAVATPPVIVLPPRLLAAPKPRDTVADREHGADALGLDLRLVALQFPRQHGAHFFRSKAHEGQPRCLRVEERRITITRSLPAAPSRRCAAGS